MKRLVEIGFIKLYTGFAIVLSVTFFSLVYNYYSAKSNKAIIHELNNERMPYISKLEELRLMLNRSKMYTTNWVFLQFETNPDRQATADMQDKDYPRLKKELGKYINTRAGRTDKDTMARLFTKFEELIKVEKDIMEQLASFEDYQSASNKFLAEDMLESEVLPRSKGLISTIDRLINKNNIQAEAMTKDMNSSLNSMLSVVLFMSIGVFSIVFLLALYIHRSITTPVMEVKRNLSDLSIGKMPEHHIAQKDDVIGQMVKAVQELNASFDKTSVFAMEIGHGNLNADFTPLSVYDRLGNSLLEMRKSLKEYSEEMEQKVADRTLEISRQKELIEVEKKKSDDLLLNILPQEVAEELKVNGLSKARSFEFVTVMFADIKNFTKVAERLSPEALVAEIDFYFRKFDEITDKYHIEKIKTIGDAYMCASGLPMANTNGPEIMVNASIEIQAFVQTVRKERIQEGRDTFDLRIGIHCGPVVAGIVGMKKFAYDIWGDTVNTAARMEQNSEPGKINISEALFDHVKDKFVCSYRGKIEAKNKGQISMYFVEAVKEPENILTYQTV